MMFLMIGHEAWRDHGFIYAGKDATTDGGGAEGLLPVVDVGVGELCNSYIIAKPFYRKYLKT